MKKSPSADKIPPDLNLAKLVEKFSQEDKAREYLTELRWPKGIVCPRCESDTALSLKHNPKFHCRACRHDFCVTTGTFFNATRIPLWKWFLAVYLMTESEQAINARQIHRALDVTYVAAWFLCHRIRAATKEALSEPLKGDVNVAKTLGGDNRRKAGRGYRRAKFPVIGTLKREGAPPLEVLQWVDRQKLDEFIRGMKTKPTMRNYMDEPGGYLRSVERRMEQKTLNDGAKKGTRGQSQVLNVRSVWPLFRRSLSRSYHNVSLKHLDAYLAEQEHRFYNRQNKFLFRDTLLMLVRSERLNYKDLTK